MAGFRRVTDRKPSPAVEHRFDKITRMCDPAVARRAVGFTSGLQPNGTFCTQQYEPVLHLGGYRYLEIHAWSSAISFLSRQEHFAYSGLTGATLVVLSQSPASSGAATRARANACCDP
ncbi:hypothetical protein N7510_006828 [Penicillium lagena]|uniref:uncharacterized protein n=1 Tax=Penicillium lagena TaxID=94218 RepID=UPI002540108B|nr:uncharacterized protein N7510_006828 [Penicillium lagena]KAJ5610109.1 hypothetical protein N7510_006828 [Penicillium lagena]